MFSFSRFGWFLHKVMVASITNSKSKYSCVIIFFSAAVVNMLDHILGFRNTTISKQKDSLFVSFSVQSCCRLDWLKNLGTSVIGWVSSDLIRNLFEHMIIVWLHFLWSLEISVLTSKTNDLEHTTLWKTLEEKFKCFYSRINSASTHWATAIDNKDKAKLALTSWVYQWVIDLILGLIYLEVLWLLALEGWHELSHESNFSIFFLVKELWLLHASRFVKNVHVALQIHAIGHGHLLITFFKDIKVFRMVDLWKLTLRLDGCNEFEFGLTDFAWEIFVREHEVISSLLDFDLLYDFNLNFGLLSR